jgi:hypothetical protein
MEILPVDTYVLSQERAVSEPEREAVPKKEEIYQLFCSYLLGDRKTE